MGKIGYYVAYFSVVLILFWVGVFKFTPTEAEAIRPLVENHPLMWWLYSIFSVQTVSNLFGTVELITALLLLLGLKWCGLRRIGGLFVVVTFLITLSFLFTTPGMWRVVDGVPTTEFGILKDLAFLGIGGIIVAGRAKR